MSTAHRSSLTDNRQNAPNSLSPSPFGNNKEKKQSRRELMKRITNQLSGRKLVEKQDRDSEPSLFKQLLERESTPEKNTQLSSMDNRQPNTAPYSMKFNFGPDKIMVNLSKERLKKLYKYWEKIEDGLELAEVIKMLIKEIDTKDDEEKFELIYGIYELFQEVDINGDGSLECGEFMQYIIDAVDGSNIKGGEGKESVQEQLEAKKALNFKRFQNAFLPMDNTNHYSEILQTINLPSIRQVLVLEKYQTNFRLYDYSMKVVRKLDVPFQQNAFILSIALDEKNQFYGVCGSDKRLYFFKKSKFKFEFIKSVECPVLMSKIWYLPEKKLWLTTGPAIKRENKKMLESKPSSRTLTGSVMSEEEERIPGQTIYKMYEWDRTLSKITRDFTRHNDEITCCINIEQPQAIATCSLDRTISIFDLTHSTVIRKIDEKHENGIRVLRYQKDNGNTMISIGNEIYANVWQPESLVSDVHIGKLKGGHKVSIVDGNYLGRAPFFATVDVENNVIFWDIKTLTAVQQIKSNMSRQITGLLVLNSGVIWTYSRRFMQIDNDVDNKEDSDPADNKVNTSSRLPLTIAMNLYNFTQVIVTKKDIKMYSAETGELQSVISNVFKSDDPRLEISSFKLDKRHRKAYLANSEGFVYVINAINGVIIKNVTQYIEDQQNIEIYKKEQVNESLTSLGSSNYESDGSQDDKDLFTDAVPENSKDTKSDSRQKKKNEVKEIENQVMMMKHRNDKFEDTNHLINPTLNLGMEVPASSVEKNIVLDNPEIFDIQLLWEDDMIMMLCANKKEYFVWDERDEEQSKLLRRVSGGHKEEITILAFDNHLSLVATGCINGEITLYDFELSKIEGIMKGHTGDITALTFFSPYPILISASMDCTICIWSVRPCPSKMNCLCLSKLVNWTWNGKEEKQTPISRIKVWNQTMKGIKQYRKLKGRTLNSSRYRKFDHNFAFGMEPVEQIFKHTIRPTMQPFVPDPPEEEQFNQVIKTDYFQYLLEDEVSDTFMTQGKMTKKIYNDEFIHKVIERTFIYLGDEEGFLKCWDITQIITRSGLKPVKQIKETRTAYNPYRMEKLNVQELARQMRTVDQHEIPNGIDPSMCNMQVREVKAHHEVITSIDCFDLGDLKGIQTCSNDLKFRNWNLELDMLGEINSKNDKLDPQWSFDTNMFKQKREENIALIEEALIDVPDSDLMLENNRRNFVISDNKYEEVQVITKKPKTDWYTQQQQMEAKDRKMEEDRQAMIKQHHNEKLKFLQAEQRHEATVRELELRYQAIKDIDFPIILSDQPDMVDGFADVKSAREFQDEVNKRMEIFLQNVDKAGDKSSSINQKTMRRGMTRKTTQLSLATRKQSTNLRSSKQGSPASIKASKKNLQLTTDLSTEKFNSLNLTINQRSLSLAATIDNNPEKFKSSTKDKETLEHQIMPTIRKQLIALKNPKERQQQESIEEMRSQYNKIISKKQASSTRARPFSIMDSEIQQDDIKLSMKSSVLKPEIKLSLFSKPKFSVPVMLPSINISGQKDLKDIEGGFLILKQEQSSSNFKLGGKNLNPTTHTEIRAHKLDIQEYDSADSHDDYKLKTDRKVRLALPAPFGSTRNNQQSIKTTIVESQIIHNQASRLILEKTKIGKFRNSNLHRNLSGQQTQILHDNSQIMLLNDNSNLNMISGANSRVSKNTSPKAYNTHLMHIKSTKANPFNSDASVLQSGIIAYESTQLSSTQSKSPLKSEVQRKQYEAIKEKYCGKEPVLVREKLRMKEKLEDMKDNLHKLKEDFDTMKFKKTAKNLKTKLNIDHSENEDN